MPKRISKVVENKIVRLYKGGSGTCEIAKYFKINRWTVLQYLKKHNLNPQRITRPYKNKYNIHFFSEYNKESAYWAGFIMADGNIHGTRNVLQIALAKIDEPHLKKFAKAIDFTGPIYTDISNDSRKISVSGKWFVDDLYKNYGIERKKTFTCEFPNIPKKIYFSFY